jgi:hypothetical protein
LVYSCHASGFAIGGYDLKRGQTLAWIIHEVSSQKSKDALKG